MFSFLFFRAIANGFVNKNGAFDLTYFLRYFDPYYGPVMQEIFANTLLMGVLSAAIGTLLGFIFAFAVVRCKIPGKNIVHWMAMVPTVSPPFAISLSTILLFGRNGLVTKKILGMTFGPGINDIYGMDGLVLCRSSPFSRWRI